MTPLSKALYYFLFDISLAGKLGTREYLDWALDLYQYAPFETEQQAYDDLIELAEQINNTECAILATAKGRFVAYEIEKFYLQHCPSYQSFWYLVRDKYIEGYDLLGVEDALQFLEQHALDTNRK